MYRQYKTTEKFLELLEIAQCHAPIGGASNIGPKCRAIQKMMRFYNTKTQELDAQMATTTEDEDEMQDNPLAQMQDDNEDMHQMDSMVQQQSQLRMEGSVHQMESRVQQPPRPRMEGSVQQHPDAGMQSPKRQPRYELPRVENQPDAEMSKVDTAEKKTQTTPTRPPSPAVHGTPEGVHRANGMLDTLDHVFFPAMMSLTRKFNTSLPTFGQAVAQTILQAEAVVRVSKNVYTSQFATPSKNVPRHFGLAV